MSTNHKHLFTYAVPDTDGKGLTMVDIYYDNDRMSGLARKAVKNVSKKSRSGPITAKVKEKS